MQVPLQALLRPPNDVQMTSNCISPSQTLANVTLVGVKTDGLARHPGLKHWYISLAGWMSLTPSSLVH